MTDVYSHPDYQQFLARIRERPDDDVVRLVFADWLEDRGQGDRAEFVRVCCGHRERGDDPIARILGGTAEWATCGIAPDWSWSGGGTAEPYPDPVVVLMTSGVRLHFHRGFVSRVSGPLASLHVGEKCKRKVCVNGRVWVNGNTQRDCRLSSTASLPRLRAWWVNGNTQRDCRLCHGTGRTPGILAELLRREPIGCDGIEVTDREPWGVGYSRAAWPWVVEDLGIGPASARIPADLFTAMEELGANVLEFPATDAARLALSRALYSLSIKRGVS